jgi:hypothetical protein
LVFTIFGEKNVLFVDSKDSKCGLNHKNPGLNKKNLVQGEKLVKQKKSLFKKKKTFVFNSPG